MFGRKCSLCGGKLDNQGICTECGLDNTKNDQNYQINKSDCDHLPLTHVHTEQPEREEKKSKKTQKKQAQTYTQMKQPQTYTQMKQPQKKKRGCGCVSVFAVVFILIILISMIGPILNHSDIFNQVQYQVGTLFGDDDSDDDNGEWEDRDPYENVTREIPADGSEASYTLESGCYLVGVQIPEGIYQAELEDDFDVIHVQDDEQQIYLYEYPYMEEEEGSYLDDLRLYEGAVLYVTTRTQAVLSTSNAQPLTEKGMENPVQQEWKVTGTMTAGEDLEPGVYDVEVAGGEGYLTVHVDLNNEYDDYREEMIALGEDQESGMIYRNLIIPAGTELDCDPGLELRLVPSKTISSTDYLSFYEY